MSVNTTKQPLSVVIIALNAAQQMEASLASAKFADDIVVVDSGSNDATVEIARKHGARVIVQPWLGFGLQKQFAVKQAKHDWVLCIDTDEIVSERLQSSIIAALTEKPQYHAYHMPRCNRFMGRWLKHGEGYPDWSLRLFDRRFAQWSSDAVHEKVETSHVVGTLRGDLLHESESGIVSYFDKQNRYTTLQAARMAQQGKRATVAQLVFSPAVRFIKFYFLRLGFLDGLPGLIHISIGCMNSFSKYAKLIALSREKQ